MSEEEVTEKKTVGTELAIPLINRMKSIAALLGMEQRMFIAEAIVEKCDKEVKERNLTLL